VASSGRSLGALATAGGAVLAWSLFEAQWVEARTLQVSVPGLAPALDGLSILHLSDLHVGVPSQNGRTLRKAVDFGVREAPDLVAITGDIVNHPRGRRHVVDQLARLAPPLGMFAVLGNHDSGWSKDPFSRGEVITDWGPAPVRLLRDEAVTLPAAAPVEVAGLDPGSWVAGTAHPERLFSEPGAFRILLAHYPDVIELLPEGACSLVLAGHYHGGQICLGIPGVPGAKLHPPHERSRYQEGIFRKRGVTMVVSRGTGTTLVPLRLFARPEVALLRLRARRRRGVPAPGAGADGGLVASRR
jgi:uncharacterized protein